MLAEHQVRVDPILDGRKAQLVEAQRLRRGPPAASTISQRVTPPEPERLAQLRLRAGRVPLGERIAPRRCVPLEPRHVDGLGNDTEDVPRRPRQQQVGHPRGLECPPHPRHIPLQRLDRCGRRIVTPEGIHQGVARDHLPGLQREQGQHHSLLGPADPHPAPRPRDLQRTQ